MALASVVVGNFNRASFIEQAIRSVAAQSLRNFDCVDSDDTRLLGFFPQRIELR